MYQKLNQNKAVKILLAAVAVAMLFGFVGALPYGEIHEAQASLAVNAIGAHFGGKIISFVPGYPWTVGVPPAAVYGFCPPHVIVLSFGAPYRGTLALTIPPIIPKGYYNYFTPGVAVSGGYYPVPLAFPSPYSCPYETAIPLFQTSLMGSGIVPSK